MSNYWDGFNKRYARMLQAANIVALEQTNTKNQFKKENASIFDRDLTDIRRYRRNGKYITPYHVVLLNKRRNNQRCCPVFDIPYKLMAQKETDKEYRIRVYSDEKVLTRRIEMNLMDLNTAFESFVEDYLLPVFYNQDKAFQLDSHNEATIKDLVSYFTRQQDSKLNIKKGICLYGGIGTGKSTIMRELSKFTKDNDLATQFSFVYMDDIYTDCDSQGLEALNSYKFRSCSFDDIGMRAENNVNNYGTKINAYRELVRRQYNRYSRPIPSLSHYTTNIEYNNKDYIAQLVKVFGGRELDRFREMCNFVPLLGQSRRL